METSTRQTHTDDKIALRLNTLRRARGWSLDDLAHRSSISRATLSRLENGVVSPTISVLGKLCTVYELTMSRLMAMVETDFEPLITTKNQTVWRDRETAFTRKSVSPPSESLCAEVLQCEIPAQTQIEYEKPPKPGLEHHLLLLNGQLTITIDDTSYELNSGDCLRYLLFGRSVFMTKAGVSAKYLLVIV